MLNGIALLLVGGAVFSVAGGALSARLARILSSGRRSRGLLVPLVFLGLSALACAALGDYTLYRHLRLGLPLAASTASAFALVGLLVGLLLLRAELPPRPGGGGQGPDDLPPPPDPDGPDGWAAFERGFREYSRGQMVVARSRR